MGENLKKAIKLLQDCRFICNTKFSLISYRVLNLDRKFIFLWDAAIARRGPEWEPSCMQLLHLERVFNLYSALLPLQEQEEGDWAGENFRSWKFTSYLLQEIDDMPLPRLRPVKTSENLIELSSVAIQTPSEGLLIDFLQQENYRLLAKTVLDRCDDSFALFTDLTGMEFADFTILQQSGFRNYYDRIYRASQGIEVFSADFPSYCAEFEARLGKLLNHYLNKKGLPERDFHPDTINA